MLDHRTFNQFWIAFVCTVFVNMQISVDYDDMFHVFDVICELIEQKSAIIEENRFLKCIITKDCFDFLFIQWILQDIFVDDADAFTTFFHGIVV